VTELSTHDAQALARAIGELAMMAHRAIPEAAQALAARLRDHLGVTGDDVPNTGRTMSLMERPNVQLALNALAERSASWEVLGLNADAHHYPGFSLAAMVTGAWRGSGEGPRQYEDIDVGPGATLPCLMGGIILTEHDGQPVAALVVAAEHHEPVLRLEVAAPDRAVAESFLHRVTELMEEHNVFRGQIVTFAYGRFGNFGLSFASIPRVMRDQIVLRAGELDAIEEHTIGISACADELRAAGHHVKRGLLLFGPPGTGKTHTISYLLGCMAGRTTIILSGPAVAAVGQAGTIARSLQPATIVIEDVDLIAMDRGFPGGEHNALLFQLLNEMDGLADDADVLFILTTNRADLLEPALAARPGRVDQAVELALPDAPARRALLELYIGEPVGDTEGDRLVERTEGAAPAFIKELARRAALVRMRATREGTELSAMDAADRAMDAMLTHATPTLLRTLAAPGVPATDEPGPVGGWVAHPAPFFDDGLE
jgi:hypothetical protein